MRLILIFRPAMVPRTQNSSLKKSVSVQNEGFTCSHEYRQGGQE